MEHEVFEILIGNEDERSLERIEDCAKEIIELRETPWAGNTNTNQT